MHDGCLAIVQLVNFMVEKTGTEETWPAISGISGRNVQSFLGFFAEVGWLAMF